MRKVISFGIIIIFALTGLMKAQSIGTGEFKRIWGVTTDAINNQSAQVDALSHLPQKPTARIVFDEWQPATDYTAFVAAIHNVSYIMGEILDSEYMIQYNLQQYTDRTNEYMNAFANQVDIWEVGNEVNGEWCGNTSDVIAKISAAYTTVKANNKKAALTLYENWNCWENQSNEMFRWANQNIPSNMKQGLDYVLVSYYEDDCNGYQPNWQRIFDSLHVIFPNSKLGIGECGTSNASQKANYLTRYYSMHITTPKYIGGYFWWYWRQDCVPYTTKPLWKVLYGVIASYCSLGDSPEPLKETYSLSNYPNPFNPATKISFYLPNSGDVTLKIYDLLGREVETLINDHLTAGNYSIEWNAQNYSSGIYLYKLHSANYTETRKMLLVK
jgi:hypothetical protein